MHSLDNPSAGLFGAIRRFLGNRAVMFVGAALMIGAAAGLGNLATRTLPRDAGDSTAPSLAVSVNAPIERGTSPVVSAIPFEGPIRSLPAGRELGQLGEFALAVTEWTEEVTYGNARQLDAQIVVKNQTDHLVELDDEAFAFFADTNRGVYEGTVVTGGGFLPPGYRATGGLSLVLPEDTLISEYVIVKAARSYGWGETESAAVKVSRADVSVSPQIPTSRDDQAAIWDQVALTRRQSISATEIHLIEDSIVGSGNARAWAPGELIGFAFELSAVGPVKDGVAIEELSFQTWDTDGQMVPLWLSPSDPPNGDTSAAVSATAIEGVTFAELPMTAHVVIVHNSLPDGYAVYRLELPEFAKPSPNGPRLGWTNQSAADGDDLATGVAVTSDGTAYVTGTVRGLLSGGRAPGVTRSQIAAYDASGQLIWNRPINGPSWVRATDIAVSSTNLVVVAGDVAENLPGQVSAGGLWDGFVMAFDPTDGAEIWTRQFGSDWDDKIHAIAASKDGTVYVAGETRGAFTDDEPYGDWDGFIRLYDREGHEIWTRQFGTERADFVSAVAVDDTVRIIVVGETTGAFVGFENPSRRSDAFVAVFDESGERMWLAQFGGNGDEGATATTVDPKDGAIFVGGYRGGVLPTKGFLRAFTLDGDLLWKRDDGTSGPGWVASLVSDGTGRIWIASRGLHESVDDPERIHQDSVASVLRVFGRDGIPLWVRWIGDAEENSATDIAAVGAGDLRLVGSVSSGLFGSIPIGTSDSYLIEIR